MAEIAPDQSSARMESLFQTASPSDKGYQWFSGSPAGRPGSSLDQLAVSSLDHTAKVTFFYML